MGRMMEATQFVVQDYDLFKAGSKFDSPIKMKALELLKKQEDDAKSPLNTQHGGLSNVRRIRVLKDSDDTSPEMVTLALAFDFKNNPADVARKKNIEERNKESNKNYTFPLWILDVKARLTGLIKATAESVLKQGFPPDLPDTMLKLAKQLEESRMEMKVLLEIRVGIGELINFTNEDANDVGSESLKPKRELFHTLDYIQSLLKVCSMGETFDRVSFEEYYKRIRPPRPQFNKGGPQKGRPDDRGKNGGGKPHQKRPDGPPVNRKPQNTPQA